ncbi:hypothetical protein L1765_06225 [Microaerobacter geothermalis]|uniref:hypothetical protein n=1 Tax=Microaerobacter geothermalis TaxID=674972 RepID=UPI001F2DC343|nr:hypothetical protein [Microaerobacter geothermalis]MCF6093583.1 hypothetical protein [Microaerobacter geothermalis]
MEKSLDLSSLLGKIVRVERGGPESKCGRLISFKSDYFVLYCEDDGEIIYYQTNHVKSISINTQDYSDQTVYSTIQYFDHDNLVEVLQNMVGRWIQINRGGPECIQGVLSDVFDDSILLVVKNEVVKIFTFHIRSISYVTNHEKDKLSTKEVQKDNKEDKNEDTSKQEDK